MGNRPKIYFAFCTASVLVLASIGAAQRDPDKQKVRTVSIPISIYTKSELEQAQTEEMLQIDRLIVKENNQEQTILSIRSRADVPISLAILIQDDLSSDFNLHIRDIARFVQNLPRGSRVMVGYMSGGSLNVRQRFTEDLTKAAKSFRVVFGSPSAAPRSPYDGVSEALDRFDALPTGRRAILLVSNGLDLSSGISGSSPGQSLPLQSAILKAQRKSVAVFSIYASTTTGNSFTSTGVMNGQGSLESLADETGGRAFITGTITPLNFEPILKQLNLLISRQFLLSYLSENMKKGYYKVSVTSTNPEVKIEHPRGYYYR
jgi:VWFA-related protein